MYVGWRDLRFARGRFALVTGVVGLITMLIVLLSGLTAGLARESTSAITGLPVDHIVLAEPAGSDKASFAASSLTAAQVSAWATVPGIEESWPVGLSTTRAVLGDRSATVTTFGVPGRSHLAAGGLVGDGEVVLSTGAAEGLGATVGSSVRLGEEALRVAGVTGDASFSHTPVAWVSLPTWQAMTGQEATAVALRAPSADGATLQDADGRLGTVTTTRDGALAAIGSYTSENGSLQLMRGLLFGISALVVGAFFTVWTIQRSGDVAVLKAIGASNRWVLRDALSQSLVLLLIGGGLGTAVAAGLGAVAARAVPFVLSPTTLVLPAAVTVLLGLVGAALSVVRVTRVDPLLALGSVR